MYAAPPVVQTEVFTRLPKELYRTDAHSEWVEHRGAGPLHSFLEGPSFDRDGNLYSASTLRTAASSEISPAGDWQRVRRIRRRPNGLKIHQDGRIFVADHRHGLMSLDPADGGIDGRAEPSASRGLQGPQRPGLCGERRSVFHRPGADWAGGSERARLPVARDGELDLPVQRPEPQRARAQSRAEKILYVAVTRANRIVAAAAAPAATRSKVGIFIQLSGGLAGPDGMALDDEDGNSSSCTPASAPCGCSTALGEPL